eukprot:270897-Chlamydomonas_euryale.AAC.3
MARPIAFYYQPHWQDSSPPSPNPPLLTAAHGVELHWTRTTAAGCSRWARCRGRGCRGRRPKCAAPYCPAPQSRAHKLPPACLRAIKEGRHAGTGKTGDVRGKGQQASYRGMPGESSCVDRQDRRRAGDGQQASYRGMPGGGSCGDRQDGRRAGEAQHASYRGRPGGGSCGDRQDGQRADGRQARAIGGRADKCHAGSRGEGRGGAL